ncbi:hypothetical protein BKA83DRAFT_3999107, partial [Pisolithus microcarpus]
MSSLMVHGFFTLNDSCLVPCLKPHFASAHSYGIYHMMIVTSRGGEIPCQLVIKCGLQHAILLAGTFVFVVARAYLLSTPLWEYALLEALHFIPFPGDPSCDAYE